MKAADLRAVVERMTDAPWSTKRPGKDPDGWQLGVVIAATARGQMVYADPPGGTSPEADRIGIAITRNHVEAWIALQEAAGRLDKLSEGEFTGVQLDAVLDNIIAKLSALEALP